MAAKINLMKQACADLKMFLPSEPTKGRIAEILRQCGMTAEMKNKCHGSVYKEFLDRVKGELASLQKITSTAPHIASFPVSPPDLEKETPDVYKKVYATEPPHQRELYGLQLARGCGRATRTSRPQRWSSLPPSAQPTRRALCNTCLGSTQLQLHPMAVMCRSLSVLRPHACLPR